MHFDSFSTFLRGINRTNQPCTEGPKTDPFFIEKISYYGRRVNNKTGDRCNVLQQ